MNIGIMRLSIVLVASLLASGNLALAEDTSEFARGAALYSANCNRCHNPRGPAEYSDAHWPLIVTHMRAIAGLPGDQARAINTFLRASNNPPRRVAARQEAAEIDGVELINRYGCRGCHVVGDGGGTIGPSLVGLHDRRSAEWIQDQLRDPRGQNPKTVMPQFNLSDAEIDAIVEELR